MVSEEISSSALTRMGSSTIIVEASGYNKKSFVHKPRCSHGVVPHVVMLAYPLQGHITPLHRLATLLASSGRVFVTFVTTESNVSRLRTKSASSSDSINNNNNNNNNNNKPHKANDPRWEAIQALRIKEGSLRLTHFRLLKKLGCGDIGSVYLAELRGMDASETGKNKKKSDANENKNQNQCYFAMKVMDKASLVSRKKVVRAQTEREILELLDHPFLPSLYTHFDTEKFSCLVMEFCSGGDLHASRQRQPGKHFQEMAARYSPLVCVFLLSSSLIHTHNKHFVIFGFFWVVFLLLKYLLICISCLLIFHNNIRNRDGNVNWILSTVL